jgi:hypothetical protein
MNEEMTIREFKELKKTAERKINDTLLELYKKTGLNIFGVDVSTMTVSTRQIVITDVKIDARF